MLSTFRLPWCSEIPGGPKMASDKLACATAVEIPMFGKFKRQLPEGADCAPVQVKRPRLEVETSSRVLDTSSQRSGALELSQITPISMASAASPAPCAQKQQESATPLKESRSNSVHAISPVDVKMTESKAPASKPTAAPAKLDCIAGLSPLQQVIDNEFNMAMLMKHNELRLIEQELAKCQVALEQLRRCQLRPYPGYDCPSVAVTEGTGAAIEPAPGFTRPAYPPPHGVTDGPYSRHYRQWLLHDPDFDSVPVQHLQTPIDNPHRDGARSTRNHGSVRKSVSARTHAVTTRTDFPPSIPNYPAPPPKDKSAPLVLRRSTDNQMVKLICNNCQRGNFSSIQGFLNHCRIAHKVDYKSHDLAAIDCGRPLDENDLAKLGSQEGHAPTPATATAHAPKPIVNRASTSALPTPQRELKGAVHPLNSPAATLPTPPPSVVRAPVAARTSSLPNMPLTSKDAAPLKQTSALPRLSAHFAKQGFGGDLAAAFANAKKIIDLHPGEELLTPDTPDCASPMVQSPQSHAHGMLDSPSVHTARPSSRKGHRQPAQRARPSPLISLDPQTPPDSALSPGDSTSASYSPHHADCNPGLVSDHEDDDRVSSVSEEDATICVAPNANRHTLPVTQQHCTDNVDIDMVEHDHVLDDHVFIRRNSMVATAEAPATSAQGGK